MQVLLNVDLHAVGRRAMSDYLQSAVIEVLGHHADRITRVEAHMSDENGLAKTGTHCVLEARPMGLDPVVVKERAGTAHQAIHGAVRKLEHALGSAFESHDPRRAARPRNDG